MTVDVDGRGPDPEGRPNEAPSHGEPVGESAAAPAGDPPVVDRAAAFAENPPPIPRKFVTWLVAGAAVLGLGGLGLEHLFSAAGLNPVPAAKSRAVTTTTPAAGTPTPVPPGQRNQLSAPLASFMDLGILPHSPAPPLGLVDQSGQPYSLPTTTASTTSAKAVVLTFFNGPCNDICPVMAAEIAQADTDLGAQAAHVEFVTVNTDPSVLAVSGLAGAEAASGLSTRPNWVMLTGPLSTLNAVWRSYGISITVVPKSGVEAHNNLVYFIDPQGQEVYRATPFANESRSGTYSLPTPEIDRWAAGLAAYAVKVMAP